MTEQDREELDLAMAEIDRISAAIEKIFESGTPLTLDQRARVRRLEGAIMHALNRIAAAAGA